MKERRGAGGEVTRKVNPTTSYTTKKWVSLVHLILHIDISTSYVLST